MKLNIFITGNDQAQELDFIPGSEFGTMPQGTVNISYQRLVEILGKFNGEVDDKVDAKWIVYTPHGVAVIHNWKNGQNYLGRKGLSVEKINHWHIKAHSENPVSWLTKTLGVSAKKLANV